MKINKSVIVAAALMVGLAGCKTITVPINQTQAYQLENAYGIAQSAAIAYTKLPRCTEIVVKVCSKASVVVSLAAADKKARIALKALEDFTRNPKNYPGLTFSGLFDAAKLAISTFKEISKVK